MEKIKRTAEKGEDKEEEEPETTRMELQSEEETEEEQRQQICMIVLGNKYAGRWQTARMEAEDVPQEGPISQSSVNARRRMNVPGARMTVFRILRAVLIEESTKSPIERSFKLLAEHQCPRIISRIIVSDAGCRTFLHTDDVFRDSIDDDELANRHSEEMAERLICARELCRSRAGLRWAEVVPKENDNEEEEAESDDGSQWPSPIHELSDGQSMRITLNCHSPDEKGRPAGFSIDLYRSSLEDKDGGEKILAIDFVTTYVLTTSFITELVSLGENPTFMFIHTAVGHRQRRMWSKFTGDDILMDMLKSPNVQRPPPPPLPRSRPLDSTEQRQRRQIRRRSAFRNRPELSVGLTPEFVWSSTAFVVHFEWDEVARKLKLGKIVVHPSEPDAARTYRDLLKAQRGLMAKRAKRFSGNEDYLEEYL